jgi:hypothetical protein
MSSMLDITLTHMASLRILFLFAWPDMCTLVWSARVASCCPHLITSSCNANPLSMRVPCDHMQAQRISAWEYDLSLRPDTRNPR